ncbi:MAG: hypothetical protein KC478_10810, partial [Bacteriovoracaceae bacterium]|nr:hypothetical protein [Bacteriovoracaceae bacterium]
MKFIQSLIILLLVSCSEVPKVTIIKQWHLAPGKKTQNVQGSMKLPQFVNQKDIYEYLEKKGGSSITVIAEGCEGEVDTSFNETFNGWTMDELIKQKDQIHFKDIMAPVWMKLKAKNPKKYNVVCGDNLQDIERNKLAMSDLRGFVGFYERMKASSAKPSAFNMYAKSLSELEGRKIANPLEFSRKAALDSLKESRDLIEKRNLSFLKIIKKNIDSNPYVVIGGIHAQHLTDLLKEQGIAFDVVEPKGYSS